MNDWLRDKSAFCGVGYVKPEQPITREPLDPQVAEAYRERMRRALEGTETSPQSNETAPLAD